MKKRRNSRLMAILITLAILTGCGTAYNDTGYKTESAYDSGGGYATTDTAAAAETYVYEEDYSYAEAAEEGYEAEGAAEVLDENVQTAQRKLIRTVRMNVETENYDALLGSLQKQITDLGGYIEYQYQYNGSQYASYKDMRSAQLDIRIPASRLDEFIVMVGGQSNITNKEEQVEDVTLQYVDLESRKKALETEQERLLELLTQAESVEDIITIEQRLSDVRYELESMESQLRTLVNQIDYSTIHLNIEEVRQFTPTEETSALDKMKNGFVRSLYSIGDDIESGFIWFVAHIPYLVIWALILLVIVLLLMRHRRRKRARLEAMQENTTETKDNN
ncbi:MAG: DUF4349 domain-containing protein [Ruminococcus sp.]|nr:DUF4349 domain-containing protein [Ruminococcus sp.]